MGANSLSFSMSLSDITIIRCTVNAIAMAMTCEVSCLVSARLTGEYTVNLVRSREIRSLVGEIEQFPRSYETHGIAVVCGIVYVGTYVDQ